ncbi:chemotaxis protein CheD [Methylophaga sp.]|uniref:chemotaxis protein CheD n=1 Tax=Methylophaga sp. TaxID=2024840 RepID=UPI002726EF18|nr:chemotaxis protein CheD [Methylophaga sp.]MDO8828358.1 chemotaxis protein CheD [Methylophaga sp.]
MTNIPSEIIDIFLRPGDTYFGNRNHRIRTMLGSCVAIVFWHQRLCLGGMCHFMLPTSGARKPTQKLDGRYADEAVLLLMHEMKKHGAPHTEYKAKIFGGGDMFSTLNMPSGLDIGQQNIEAAKKLIIGHGFDCIAHHLGGYGHRNVIFNVWNGDVWMRHNHGESKASHSSIWSFD